MSLHQRTTCIDEGTDGRVFGKVGERTAPSLHDMSTRFHRNHSVSPQRQFRSSFPGPSTSAQEFCRRPSNGGGGRRSITIQHCAIVQRVSPPPLQIFRQVTLPLRRIHRHDWFPDEQRISLRNVDYARSRGRSFLVDRSLCESQAIGVVEGFPRDAEIRRGILAGSFVENIGGNRFEGIQRGEGESTVHRLDCIITSTSTRSVCDAIIERQLIDLCAESTIHFPKPQHPSPISQNVRTLPTARRSTTPRDDRSPPSSHFVQYHPLERFFRTECRGGDCCCVASTRASGDCSGE